MELRIRNGVVGGNQTSISIQMIAECEGCRVPSLRGVGCEGVGMQGANGTTCEEYSAWGAQVMSDAGLEGCRV